jgi:uracil-DNA glycosylase
LTTFVRLVDEIRSCTICSDYLPLGPRPVLQAHPAARILIVGQAPGTAVHKSGIPFTDPSGDRLREWLGVDRDEFYSSKLFAIVPMGFCYPGRGKGGDLPPRAECATTWRKALLSHLTNIELTVVVGRYAIDWHINPPRSATLGAVVAQWREHWPQLVPLPHPSPRNTKWLRSRPWVEAEIVPQLQSRIRALLSNATQT